jgi:hypothetical protein
LEEIINRDRSTRLLRLVLGTCGKHKQEERTGKAGCKLHAETPESEFSVVTGR